MYIYVCMYVCSTLPFILTPLPPPVYYEPEKVNITWVSFNLGRTQVSLCRINMSFRLRHWPFASLTSSCLDVDQSNFGLRFSKHEKSRSSDFKTSTSKSPRVLDFTIGHPYYAKQASKYLTYMLSQLSCCQCH